MLINKNSLKKEILKTYFTMEFIGCSSAVHRTSFELVNTSLSTDHRMINIGTK